MKAHSLNTTKPTLKVAVEAAWEVLNKYFKELIATRYLFIATIVNPWYKLYIFKYLYLQEGGTSALIYRKGKAYFESTYAKYKT
jgi:hypothetical protein